MYEGHWFGGGLMWLFWALVVAVILWALKISIGSDSSDKQSTAHISALEILKERFARGEIDQEEFESKKKHLLS
jgi:putative membrane protein